MAGLDDRVHARGLGRILIPAALTLSVAAAAALAVGSDDAALLRLGVVAALWAALFGAFAAFRLRRSAGTDAERAEDLKAIYHLELEREIAARREHALTVEAEVRRQVEDESRDELEALRAELRTLRENLQTLLDGQLLVERVALRAESTRLLPVTDGTSPGGVHRPGPGRAPVAPSRRSLPTGERPLTVNGLADPQAPPAVQHRPRSEDDVDTLVDGPRATPAPLPRRDRHDRSGPTRRPVPPVSPPVSQPVSQPQPAQPPPPVPQPAPPVSRPQPAPPPPPPASPPMRSQPVPVPADAGSALTGEMFRVAATPDPLFDKDWRPAEPARNGSAGPNSVPFAVPSGPVEDYVAGPALAATNGYSGHHEPVSRRSRRRRYDDEPPSPADLGRHRASAAEHGGGGGRRRMPEEPAGAHAAGARSVHDLLSAYQSEEPRGRHGR